MTVIPSSPPSTATHLLSPDSVWEAMHGSRPSPDKPKPYRMYGSLAYALHLPTNVDRIPASHIRRIQSMEASLYRDLAMVWEVNGFGTAAHNALLDAAYGYGEAEMISTFAVPFSPTKVTEAALREWRDQHPDRPTDEVIFGQLPESVSSTAQLDPSCAVALIHSCRMTGDATRYPIIRNPSEVERMVRFYQETDPEYGRLESARVHYSLVRLRMLAQGSTPPLLLWGPGTAAS